MALCLTTATLNLQILPQAFVDVTPSDALPHTNCLDRWKGVALFALVVMGRRAAL